MIKAIPSNKFLEGSFRVALRTPTLESFIVRVGVTRNTVIVGDIAKLLEFYSVFGADLVTLDTIHADMFTGQSVICIIVIEL